MPLSSPLPVHPRIDAKPWGGTRLPALGFDLPPGGDPPGEALISIGDAVVETGDGEFLRLADLAARAPEALVGARGRELTAVDGLFPLLAKFIDARDDLSIQVHPDDALAREQGEPTGKTEAWHILAAEPGAVLYMGLADGVSPEAFTTAVEAGDPGVREMLNAVPAVPGETWLLPAGSVHALGAGVLIYEIQQPSNTTYRLYDWNRPDASGSLRELHLDLGRRAMKPGLRPRRIAPLALPSMSGDRELLVATRAFALERLMLRVGDLVDYPADDSPQVLTCLGGVIKVAGGGRAVRLQRGESVIVPAGVIASLTASMPGIVLRAWAPDLARDVIRPARAGGASLADVVALSAPLDDIRTVLAAEA